MSENDIYCEAHRAPLEDALTQALSDAITTKAADPMRFIAESLMAKAAPAPAPADAPHAVTQMTTRMRFRQSVNEVIGSGVQELETGQWKEDYIPARDEGLALLKAQGKGLADEPYRETIDSLLAYNRQSKWHAQRIEAGLTEAEADVMGVVLSSPIVAAIGNALDEKTPNPVKGGSQARARYAHLTHACASALAARAKRAQTAAPPLYAHLEAGGKGLADKDPRWKEITTPDSSGFKGLTTFNPLPLRPAHHEKYAPNGIMVKGSDKTYSVPQVRLWCCGVCMHAR